MFLSNKFGSLQVYFSACIFGISWNSLFYFLLANYKYGTRTPETRLKYKSGYYKCKSEAKENYSDLKTFKREQLNVKQQIMKMPAFIIGNIVCVR